MGFYPCIIWGGWSVYVVHCTFILINDCTKFSPYKVCIAYLVDPVTAITINPAGTNGEVSVVLGKTKSFSCRTNSVRPVAAINWYINQHSVTRNATLSSEQDSTDTTKVIPTSTLVYTGNDDDHGKVIQCTANNVDDEQLLMTANRKLFIKGKKLSRKNLNLKRQRIDEKCLFICASWDDKNIYISDKSFTIFYILQC